MATTRTNVAIAGDQDIIFSTCQPRRRHQTRRSDEGREPHHPPRPPHDVQRRPAAVFRAQVRRAINMAIDRKGIANAVLRHPGSAATQLLPAAAPDWHDAGTAIIPIRCEWRRCASRSGGWVRGARRCALERRHTFSAKMFTVANRPELAVIGTAMQAQLKTIGMESRSSPCLSQASLQRSATGRCR